MGASRVKWITPNSCLVLSESDSELYTNFEFCEEANHRDILKTYWFTKPSQLWWPKKLQRKSLHILEDGTSVVQVGDIEQVTV